MLWELILGITHQCIHYPVHHWTLFKLRNVVGSWFVRRNAVILPGRNTDNSLGRSHKLVLPDSGLMKTDVATDYVSSLLYMYKSQKQTKCLIMNPKYWAIGDKL